MKKLLVPMLVLLLFLAGCAAQDVQDSSQTTASPTASAQQGLYVPDSAVEQQTKGAVRLYNLKEDSYQWLSAIGDQLLLASDSDPAEMTVLTGADCVPTAVMVAASDLKQLACRTTYNGFVYYSEAEKQAVFLDPQLQEVNRLQLPEDIQGKPVFSPDGGEIFYCTDREIRALEVERRISRLVKSHSFTSQALLAVYFEGKLLACRVEDAQGEVNTIYVSTETGQTVYSYNDITQLFTYENNFLAVRADGTVRQCIIGNMDGTVQQLNVQCDNVTGALELGGAVCYSVDDDNGLHLAFYDLTSGKKTAAIDLRGVGAPKAFLADRWTGCLWILARDPATGSKSLLRWSLKDSAVEEDAVYTGPLYTAENPDKAGLSACSKRVSAIDKAYGVRTRIWQEAVKYPGSYKLEGEYQTGAINRCLDALEPVLNEFPKNFLLKSISSRIRICIVRSIDGEAKAVQYWDDGDAFIVLSVGVDVRREFMKGLGYVINSHVLGNSPVFDSWEGLNPEGFVYGKTTDEKYLKGDTKAFVDEMSMNSVTEDRSRIFWQAMLPENSETFQSETMQKKLLQLCRGIRDAWNLERKTESYPWEQYLTESIAYQK